MYSIRMLNEVLTITLPIKFKGRDFSGKSTRRLC